MTAFATMPRRVSCAADVSGPGFALRASATMSACTACAVTSCASISPTRNAALGSSLRFFARRQRQIARALGDAQIRGVDDGQRDQADDVHRRMPLPGRTAHALRRRLGNEDVLQLDVVRPGAAHAEHAPRVEHGHARRVDRHREMDDGRPVRGIVVDARSSSARSPPGAPLPKILRPFILKPPSTLVSVPDPASQSAPPLVTRTSVLGGDLAQHRLGPLVAGAPGVGHDRDHVRVHRGRQRRRAAMMRQLADHRAQLRVRRAAAAELGGHAGGEQAALLQRGVVLATNESAASCSAARAANAGPSSRAMATKSVVSLIGSSPSGDHGSRMIRASGPPVTPGLGRMLR